MRDCRLTCCIVVTSSAVVSFAASPDSATCQAPYRGLRQIRPSRALSALLLFLTSTSLLRHLLPHFAVSIAPHRQVFVLSRFVTSCLSFCLSRARAVPVYHPNRLLFSTRRQACFTKMSDSEDDRPLKKSVPNGTSSGELAAQIRSLALRWWPGWTKPLFRVSFGLWPRLRPRLTPVTTVKKLFSTRGSLCLNIELTRPFLQPCRPT